MLPNISGEFGVVFEPEIKFNTDGKAWIKIRGAANDSVYNAETNQWEKKGDTTYVDIIMGGTLAENLVESVTVGDQIVVHGTLNQRDWVTEEGEKRTSYQIRARSVGVGIIGGPVKTKRMLGESKVPAGAAPQADEAPF